jgi:hypothetical protein
MAGFLHTEQRRDSPCDEADSLNLWSCDDENLVSWGLRLAVVMFGVNVWKFGYIVE